MNIKILGGGLGLLVVLSCLYIFSTEELDTQSIESSAASLLKKQDTKTENALVQYNADLETILGNSPFQKLDDYAKNTPAKYEESIAKLVEYLLIPTSNEVEKVRVLFSWVAMHVAYDDEGYNSGKYASATAEDVLKSKKAVCEGYANLFVKLCETAGLVARKVVGYSKGYSYSKGQKFKDSDHAWNVVRINEKWRLFDVTWAAGVGKTVKGKLQSHAKFDDYWFITNPKEFIFTHLPEKSSWQLLPMESRLSLSQYEQLPNIRPSFFKIWGNTSYVFANAISGKTKEFVKSYSIDYDIKVTKLASTRNMLSSKTYTMEVLSEDASEIIVVNNGKSTAFVKNDNTFTLKFKPQKGSLMVCGMIDDSDTYNTFLEYVVLDNPNI